MLIQSPIIVRGVNVLTYRLSNKNSGVPIYFIKVKKYGTINFYFWFNKLNITYIIKRIGIFENKNGDTRSSLVCGEKMNLNQFFEKEDLLAYSLLQQLVARPSMAITVNEVLVNESISQYQLNKAISTLNNDLSNLQNGDPSMIELPEKNIIQGINLTTTVIQELRLVYLKRSTLFLVFEYQFIYSNRISKTNFMQQHFISKTSFYNTQLQLRALLRKANCYQFTGLVDDQEYSIRLHLFQIFYIAFSGIEHPFAKLEDATKKVVNQIEQQFECKTTPTQQAKLNIFLKIWLLRIKNDCHIKEPIIADLKFETPMLQKLDHIKQIIGAEFNLTIDQQEANYLLSFLITQGYIDDAAQRISPVMLPLAYSMTDKLLQRISASHVLVDTSALKNLPH